MALINCPECGKEKSDQVNTCVHCGYKVKKLSNKKILYPVIPIAILLLLVVGFLFYRGFNISPNEKIALQACKDLQSNLKDRNSLELYEIYVNNEKSNKTTIKYTDRVYIKYGAKNSYGGIQSGKTLCLVSDSKNSFICKGDSKEGDAYLTVAEFDIYGKLFEPDGSWEKIDEKNIINNLK